MALPKVKLLCLHGYTQSAASFSSRTGSLRKGLKSRCEFVYLDAPFQSTGLPSSTPSSDEVNESQGLEEGGRSWWQWKDTGPSGRPSLAAEYTGWETSLEVLLEAVREHRPDGVLGFSQGATATALFLAHLQSQAVREQLGADHPPPRFAIMVAGFVPRDSTYAASLSMQPISVPALFVYGTKDTLVPVERSQALVNCFDSSLTHVFSHEGAHMVPTCTGDFKKAIVAFLDEHRVAAT